MRSTSDVLAHHLKCFAARDLEGLMADYAAGALFFTPDGVLRTVSGSGCLSPAGSRRASVSEDPLDLSRRKRLRNEIVSTPIQYFHPQASVGMRVSDNHFAIALAHQIEHLMPRTVRKMRFR